jgi:hypothetical protein
MGFQYSFEELQHLRASPLVQKPPGLPPAEEWMGYAMEQAVRQPFANASRPPAEQTQKRTSMPRGGNEGVLVQNDTARAPLHNRQLPRQSGSSKLTCPALLKT